MGVRSRACVCVWKCGVGRGVVRRGWGGAGMGDDRGRIDSGRAGFAGQAACKAASVPTALGALLKHSGSR